MRFLRKFENIFCKRASFFFFHFLFIFSNFVQDSNCDPSIRYKSVVTVGDIDYIGEGPNKRTAKTASAREALQQKFGINPEEYVEDNRMDFMDEVEPKHEATPEVRNLSRGKLILRRDFLGLLRIFWDF